MPSVPLHIAPSTTTNTSAATSTNALPPLLHTPTGLALLEIQGTINFPISTLASETSTLVGKLVFPLYNPAINGEDDTKWMKRVYFYVGRNQRMTGEVKKLGMPFAVVGRKGWRGDEGRGGGVDVEMGGVEGGDREEGRGDEDELEIVEVVRYKVVFSARPEPVGGGEDGQGD
ncbi:hypothetical protein P280DRAFT_527890 [Massarina eburnea CBS 473.64]|uniref:Chromosome transmission fidelity protein 8 n=1 Tax=Massarina eburnea CBS 473.64 TaxID=1395130 RepID=A0A6A6RUP8_9PLEO|nr:hypothetical protein P280DRAFT_527890 [Massarina eburnea CBS 473.64]